MKKQESTEWKLTRARTQLVLNQPFFGTLCLRLKLMAGTVPTMSKDGTRIVYYAAFVDGLKPAELEGVLAHEVSHCALGHQCRRGNRDPKLWNIAADYAINPILVANGFTLPPDVLIDPAFSGLSAEEIYARLLRKGGGSGAASDQEQQGVAGSDPGVAENGCGTQSNPPSDPNSQSTQAPPDQSRSCTNPSEGPSQGRPGGFGEGREATDDDGKPASQDEK